MPLELAQLDALVVALATLVRLLVGVAVPHVTDQLAGGGEAQVAELAVVRLRTCNETQTFRKSKPIQTMVNMCKTYSYLYW